MKRIFTSALVLALAIGGANAQTTSTEKGKGMKKEQKGQRKGNHGKMYDQLNLTADQKSRLQTLRDDYKRQSEELRNNTTLTAEQKQTRRKELHQQFRTQSSAILTPAQREQAEKMKAEWKANGKAGKFNKGEGSKRGHAGAGRGFEGRGEAFQKDLNLTQEQQTKMQQIRTDFRSKFEALRNDNALTQEQKRAKMQELMQSQQAQFKSILTKEQIEKLESQKKERSSRNTR